MSLKAKSVTALIMGLAATAGLLVMLTVAFMNNFIVWTTLCLLAVTIVTMVIWCWYYIALSKYKESLNPKKKKYHTKGNRKESRRKR